MKLFGYFYIAIITVKNCSKIKLLDPHIDTLAPFAFSILRTNRRRVLRLDKSRTITYPSKFQPIDREAQK